MTYDAQDDARKSYEAAIEAERLRGDTHYPTKPRVICWFSCGAASAVATKMTLREHGPRRQALRRCVDRRTAAYRNEGPTHQR